MSGAVDTCDDGCDTDNESVERCNSLLITNF